MVQPSPLRTNVAWPVGRKQTRAHPRRQRALQFESMEERTMLSITVAALGDSFTDEYQFSAPCLTAAENWPEIIANLRPIQADFGAFTTSSRGETRNQGYAQDWARYGATATGTDISGGGTTFVQQYEGGLQPGLPGLLTQPGGISDINAVNIMIGGNDYFRAIVNSVTNPSTIISNLQNASAGILSAIETVVPLIKSVNPDTRIIIDTVPNVTNIALYKSMVSNLPNRLGSQLTALVTSSVNLLDSQIAQYARTEGTGLVDVNGLIQNFIANPYFDGVYINPAGAGPAFTDLLVGDGVHPGTIAQAVIANAIILQIDTLFPGAITPLSSAEILHLAETVQPKTQVVLSASATDVSPGHAVTFIATVPGFAPTYETSASPPARDNLASYPVPTGVTTFLDASNGNHVLATAQLNRSGVATFKTSKLALGLHSITVAYNGDAVYPPTVSTASSLAVGDPAQVKMLRYVQMLQDQLGIQISRPQISKWLTALQRGVSPRAVSRAIVKYVYIHSRR